jgi:hypothetical protein
MRHAVVASVVALVVFLVAAAFGGSRPDNSPANLVLIPICGIAVSVLVGGVATIFNNLYLRRVLCSHPWQEEGAAFPEVRLWWVYSTDSSLILPGTDVMSVATVN